MFCFVLDLKADMLFIFVLFILVTFWKVPYQFIYWSHKSW